MNSDTSDHAIDSNISNSQDANNTLGNNHLSPQIPPLVIKKKRKSNAELAAEAVANERDIVRNLKRLSIGGVNAAFDPELAHGETSFENFVHKQNQKRSSLVSAGGKRKSSQLSPLDFQQFDYSTSYPTSPTNNTHSHLPTSSSTSSIASNNSGDDSVPLLNHSASLSRRSSSRNYSFKNKNKNKLSASSSLNNDSVIDASKLLWVPATSHPGIAPENFRKHVQSTITEITQNLSSEDNNTEEDLPEIKVEQTNISTANNDYDNNSMPSLSDLTTELERLSTMAGLEATDAATLARTLSTSSISSFSNVNLGLSQPSGGSNLSRDSSISGFRETDESAQQQHAQKSSDSLNDTSSPVFNPDENTDDNASGSIITQPDDISKPISLPGGDIKLRRSRWTTYRKRGNTIKRKQQSSPPLPSSTSSPQSTTDSLSETAEKEILLNRRKRSQDLSKHPLPNLSQKFQEFRKTENINYGESDISEKSSLPLPKSNIEKYGQKKNNVSESPKSSDTNSMKMSSSGSNTASPIRSIPATPSTASSSNAGSPVGSPGSSAPGTPMSSKAALMSHRREERERLKQERRKLEIQRLELEKEQKRLDDIRKERLSKSNRAQHRSHISNDSPRYDKSSSATPEVSSNAKFGEYSSSRRKYVESLDPKGSSSTSSSPAPVSSENSPLASPSTNNTSPTKGIGINISASANTNGKDPSNQYQPYGQQPYPSQHQGHHQRGHDQQQYQQQKYQQQQHRHNHNNHHQQHPETDGSHNFHGRQTEHQHKPSKQRNNNNNYRRMENKREDIFSAERTQQQQQFMPRGNSNNSGSPYQRGSSRNDVYNNENRLRSAENISTSSISVSGSPSKNSSSVGASPTVSGQTTPSAPNAITTRSQSFSEGTDAGMGIGIGVNDSIYGKAVELNRSSSDTRSTKLFSESTTEETTTNSTHEGNDRPNFFRNMSFDRSQSSSSATPSSSIGNEKVSKEKKERPGLMSNHSSSNSIPKVKKNTFWSRSKNSNKDSDSIPSTSSGTDKSYVENDSDMDHNNQPSNDSADQSIFSTQESDQDTSNTSISASTNSSTTESKKEKKMFGLFKRKSFKNLKSGTSKDTDTTEKQSQPNLPSNSKEQISNAAMLDQQESSADSVVSDYNNTMEVPSIDGKFGKGANINNGNDYANNDSIFINDDDYNRNINNTTSGGSSSSKLNVAAAPNLNKGRFSVEQSQMVDSSNDFANNDNNNLGTIAESVVELAEDGSNKMEVLSWLISADHLSTLKKLHLFKQIQGSENSKPNQPVQYTDSAFGFPLPPLTHSTIIMLDHRFPMNVERAIYRLSHLKLANPKRELRQQVLLSNFMYAYLNLVNHTLLLQNMEEGTAAIGTAEGNNDNMIEMEMSQAEASAIEL